MPTLLRARSSRFATQSRFGYVPRQGSKRNSSIREILLLTTAVALSGWGATGFAGASANQPADTRPSGDVIAEVACVDVENALADGMLVAFSDAARRDAFAARPLASAEAGCGFAITIAAGLSAHGDQHPARLLPKDDAAAERWFVEALKRGNASMLGRLSDLAEARGDWESAMGFAQLEARIATMVEGRGGRGTRREAGRLLALFEQKPGTGEAEAKAAIAAVMARHGDAIAAGMAAYDDARKIARDEGSEDSTTPRLVRAPDLTLKTGRLIAVYDRLHLRYLLGVDSDGRVTRRYWIDAVPDPRLIEQLDSDTDRLRLNPAPDAPLRRALLPIGYSDSALGLGAGAAKVLTTRDADQDGGHSLR